MNRHTRRAFARLAGLSAAASLAACVGPASTAPTPSGLAADAALVAQGVAAVAAALAAQGVSIASAVEGYATTAANLATAIGAAVSTPVSSVSQLVSLIGTVATAVLAVIPGTSSIVGLVNDLVALAPAIGAAVGLLGAPTPPGLPTADAARADLRKRLGLA